MSALSDLYSKYGAPVLQNIGNAISDPVETAYNSIIKPEAQSIGNAFNNYVTQPIQAFADNQTPQTGFLGGLGDAVDAASNALSSNPFASAASKYAENIGSDVLDSTDRYKDNPNLLTGATAVGSSLYGAAQIFPPSAVVLAAGRAAINQTAGAIQAGRQYANDEAITGPAQNSIDNLQLSKGIGVTNPIAAGALDLAANTLNLNPEGVAGSVKALGSISKDASAAKNISAVVSAGKQLAGIHDAPAVDSAGNVVKDANGNVVTQRVSPTYFGPSQGPFGTVGKLAVDRFNNPTYAPGFVGEGEGSGTPPSGSPPASPGVVNAPLKGDGVRYRMGDMSLGKQADGSYSFEDNGTNINPGPGKLATTHDLSPDTRNEFINAQNNFENAKGTGVENVMKAKEVLDVATDKAIRELGLQNNASFSPTNKTVNSPSENPNPPKQAPDAFVKTAKDSGILSPESSAILPDSTHDVRNTAQAQAEADTLAKTNPDAANQILHSDSTSQDQKVMTGISLMKESSASADAQTQADLVKTTAANLTDSGRSIQAVRGLNPDSAERASLTVQRGMNKVADGQKGSVILKANEAKQSLEAAKTVTPEEVSTAGAKAATKAITTSSEPSTKIVNKPGQEPLPDQATQLAKKVQNQVKSSQKPVPENPKAQSQLVSELFKIAKRDIPPTQRGPVQSAIERIHQLFLEHEANPTVYEDAKADVREHFKNNPNALKAIADYEKSNPEIPVDRSTMTRAVRDEIKARGDDLSNIVKNTPKTDQATYARQVVTEMQRNGFSSDAQSAFLNHFQDEITSQMKVKRDAAIAQMQKTYPKTAAPTLQEKIDKLNNLGVLSNQDYLDLAKAKLGLPNMDAKTMREIGNRTDAIQALPEGDAKNIARKKLLDFMGDQIPSSLGSKAVAIYKAGILSGPDIFAKVGGSHLANAVSEHFNEQLGAKVFDPIISLTTGKRGTVAPLRGNLEGLKNGVHNALNLITHGIDPHASAEQVLNSNVNFGKSWVGRALNTYVETVKRAHGVIPSIGEAAASMRNLYDQAATGAYNKGLRGNDAETFIKDFVSNPSEDASRQAHEHGQVTAFTNKTLISEGIEAFQRAIGNGAKLDNPIVRVPAAAATAVINNSPIGLLKAPIEYGWRNYKAGETTEESQRKFAQGLARGTTGTAILGAAALGGVGAGYISTRSKNATERALKQAQGIPDNSIKIPLINKWVPDTSLGSAGAMLDAGQAFREGMQNNKKSLGSISRAIGGAALSVGQSQLDQPIFSGFVPAAAALKNPETGLQTLLSSEAKSLVPGLISNVARDTDPYQRITATQDYGSSVTNALQSAIPGLRENLPVKNSITGQPLVAQPPFAAQVPQPGSDSPALAEVTRLSDLGLSADPAPLGKNISSLGVQQNLTPQQQSDLQGIRGKAYDEQVQALIKSPEYQALSDANKAEMIKKVQTIVDTQTSLKYAATQNLTQSNQGGVEENTTQQNSQIKLQAAQAYSTGDSKSYYDLISKLPHAQQTTVADEIKAAIGDTVYGKQPTAAAQVIQGMKPAIVGPDAGQVGAASYVNNPSAFQNKRAFELNNPEHDPIYDLPDDQAKKVLLARSQSVDGQSTDLAKYIKSEDWYKAYAGKESAYFDAHPQPSQPDALKYPAMNPDQKASADYVNTLTTGAQKYAFYQTPAGKNLQSFYTAMSAVNAQKLQILGASPDEVSIAQLASQNQNSDLAKAAAAIKAGTQNSGNVFSKSSSRHGGGGGGHSSSHGGGRTIFRPSGGSGRSVSFAKASAPHHATISTRIVNKPV